MGHELLKPFIEFSNITKQTTNYQTYSRYQILCKVI